MCDQRKGGCFYRLKAILENHDWGQKRAYFQEDIFFKKNFYRPFSKQIRKSYLHEVTWSFFNRSRKSSSPQNFINESQVWPENSTIIKFSNAIKLKNIHIQSYPHYFWTTFKRRGTYSKFNRKSTVSIWNDQNSLLSLHISQTLQRRTTSIHLPENRRKFCSLAVWWNSLS